MTEQAKTTETTETQITEDMVPDFDITIGKTEITRDRALSAVRAAAMVASTVATVTGMQLDIDGIYQIVLCVLMFVSMAWGYWKNNNVTKNAIKSGVVLKSLNNSKTPNDLSKSE